MNKLALETCSRKRNSEKLFEIRILRLTGILMVPLTTLYDKNSIRQNCLNKKNLWSLIFQNMSLVYEKKLKIDKNQKLVYFLQKKIASIEANNFIANSLKTFDFVILHLVSTTIMLYVTCN